MLSNICKFEIIIISKVTQIIKNYAYNVKIMDN